MIVWATEKKTIKEEGGGLRKEEGRREDRIER